MCLTEQKQEEIGKIVVETLKAQSELTDTDQEISTSKQTQMNEKSTENGDISGTLNEGFFKHGLKMFQNARNVLIYQRKF